MSAPPPVRRFSLLFAGLLVAAFAITGPAWATPGPTTMMLKSDGSTIDYPSNPIISDDGSVVVFAASDESLGPDSGEHHYFAWHRDTGEIETVDYLPDNTTSAGGQFPDISGNGRYVAFIGYRLGDGCTPPGGDNECPEIYRRDLESNTTELVSVAHDGGFADGISEDPPSISDDGNMIAFVSHANNLVEDDTQTGADAFVRDMSAGTTKLVSVSSDGDQANGATVDVGISGDGNHVVFSSYATNLGSNPSPEFDAFVRDLDTGETSAVLTGTHQHGQVDLALDHDGQVVAFITQSALLDSDTNNDFDAYVVDRSSGQISSPEIPGGSQPGMLTLSDDGNLLELETATNFRIGVWVFDRTSGTTDLESVRADDSDVRHGPNNSYSAFAEKPGMSGDGRFVVFISDSPDVVADQPTSKGYGLFVHDRAAPQDTATGNGGASTDNGDGPTLTDTIETTVAGSPGAVSITELTPNDPANGDLTGYDVLGQQVKITAEPTTPPDYMTFTFDVDRSVVDGYSDPSAAAVLRNGEPLPDCASPDDVGPCVASRSALASGDWRFVAHTPAASTWAVAVPTGAPTGGDDGTPPQIDLRTPSDGAGYTRGESVTVDYSCEDEGGSELASCTGTQEDGAALDTSTVGSHEFTVNAEDGAGNTATTTVHYMVTGAVDTTKPTIHVVRPGGNTTYELGQRVLASYSCADPGSGVASCTGTRANGATIDTGSIGAKTFKVTARDKAGNSATKTVSYRVVWPLSGFFGPVDNPPVLNTAKAGAVIPVRFSLGGNRGTSVFAPGYPRVDAVSCPQGERTDEIESTLGGSAPSLRYANGTYTYAWHTQKAWRSSSTCRALTVRFKDGQQLLARFKLR